MLVTNVFECVKVEIPLPSTYVLTATQFKTVKDVKFIGFFRFF